MGPKYQRAEKPAKKEEAGAMGVQGRGRYPGTSTGVVQGGRPPVLTFVASGQNNFALFKERLIEWAEAK